MRVFFCSFVVVVIAACGGNAVGEGEGDVIGEGEGEGFGDGVVPVRFVHDGAEVGDVDVGSVDAGGSVDVDLVIETTVDGNVQILSDPPVLVGGRDADAWTVTTQPTPTITANGAAFRVRFAPTVGGDSLGKLLVAWGVAASQRSVVDLRGASTAPPREPGLRTFVYDGTFDVLPDFDALTPTTTTTSATLSIADRIGSDFFAYRFVGAVDVPAAGSWTFASSSDDGSRVIVDGVVVVDNDGLHGPVDVAGSVDLDEGSHAFEVQFFEKAGGEVLDVRWSGPGVAQEPIPAGALFQQQ